MRSSRPVLLFGAAALATLSAPGAAFVWTGLVAAAEQTSSIGTKERRVCGVRYRAGPDVFFVWEKVLIPKAEGPNGWWERDTAFAKWFFAREQSLLTKYGVPAGAEFLQSGCNEGYSEDMADDAPIRARSLANGHGGTTYWVPTDIYSQYLRSNSKSAADPRQGNSDGKRALSKSEPPISVAAPVPVPQSAEREAEWQKKVSAYEAEKVRQQAQVSAYEQAQADLARKKEEQRQAAEKAAEDYKRQLAEHEAQVQAQQRDAALAQAEYQRQLAESTQATRKSSYRSIPVMGLSGATREEAERNFLSKINQLYSGRTTQSYDCNQMWGRWVCRGGVEFGTPPAKQAQSDKPAKASSQ
jgi:hypothetical protein